MRTSSLVAAFLALLAPTAIAAPAPVLESREGLVRTPQGLRNPADVHLVPQGGEVRHVDDEIHLVSANGTVLHVALNDGSKVRQPAATKRFSASNGWIGYAYWTNSGSSPINSFKTTWAVPPVPATNNGQTIFLFNSIEPASGNAILQPVLQFGPSAAGGGSYWAVASWYLVGSQTYYTSPVRTSAGATLDGIITLSSSSGSKYNYVTSFTNIASTSLTATGSAQLVWATETLESYGVTSASGYPTGSTLFYDIDLTTSAGTPSVSWSTVSNSTEGVSTKVTVNGATNAEITITY